MDNYRKKTRMTHKPDPVDVYVGSRIRMRRTLLGMSQEKLSDQLGITFQQVQKYENGMNRVGSSRLFNISRALGVPIAFFFDGYREEGARTTKAAEDATSFNKLLNSKETIELIKAYYSIEDKAVRKKLYEMIKSIS